MQSTEYTLSKNACQLFANVTAVTNACNEQLAEVDMSDVYESLTTAANDDIVDLGLQSLYNIINLPNKDFTADLVGKGLVENYLRKQLQRTPGAITTESMILITGIFDALSQTMSIFTSFSQ